MLDQVGLLKYKRVGYNHQDANFRVVNREHVSRDKSYYVTEEPEIMLFLGKYENQNVIEITQEQFNSLKEAGILNENNIQKWREYVPKAVCFIDQYGNYRVRKITKVMVHLGFWKSIIKFKRIERKK